MPDVRRGPHEHSDGPVDWRESAACLVEDPELFFPIGSVGPYHDQVARALSVCRSCPVQPQCLEFALDIEAVGVWGGRSEGERRVMIRRRSRSRTPSPSSSFVAPQLRRLGAGQRRGRQQ